MTYATLQQRIYNNKVRRGFNVTDVGKELILMTEEFGELNDAYLLREEVTIRDIRQELTAKMVDAVGDLQVYNLGLASMFDWKADEVVNRKLESPSCDAVYPPTTSSDLGVIHENEMEELIEIPLEINDYFPFVARWLGKFSNAYKKSNKELVDRIDRREEFHTALGNLIGYCSKMFEVLKADEFSVLESIVKNNETRTHEGQI